MDAHQSAPKVPTYQFFAQSMAGYQPDLTPNFAVDGLLYRGEVSVLFGPSNCGKTAVVVRMAQAIVTGEALAGAEVQHGMVLYAAAEAPRSVKARAHVILPDDEARERFIVLKGRPNLNDDHYVRAFIEFARTVAATAPMPPVMVIFDTGARSFGGADENSNEAMTRVIERAGVIAMELNVHVMIIHHTGKEDRGARGASAIRDACETELRCSQTEHGRTLEVTKQRNHEKRSPLRYDLRAGVLGQDSRGKDVTAVIADFVDTDPRSSPESKPMTALMSAILTALYHKAGQGLLTQEVLEALPSQVFGGLEPAKQQRKVSDACDALAASGTIAKTKSGNANCWRLLEVVVHS